jgi:hypothetical protein
MTPMMVVCIENKITIKVIVVEKPVSGLLKIT